jgi:hypothetical protein
MASIQQQMPLDGLFLNLSTSLDMLRRVLLRDRRHIRVISTRHSGLLLQAFRPFSDEPSLEANIIDIPLERDYLHLTAPKLLS